MRATKMARKFGDTKDEAFPFVLSGAWLIFMLDEFFPIPEKEGDTPDTRQGDNRVNDTADRGALSAESPRHYVELE